MKSIFIALYALNAHSYSLKIDIDRAIGDKPLRLILHNSFQKYNDMSLDYTLTCTSEALKEGECAFENLIKDTDYSISAFVDSNKNNKLDTNFLGIPKESYGFSKNPKILMRKPTFERVKFRNQSKLKIKLN